MKTGILGGTFDPVHIGHLKIARAAMDEYGLDEVRFMPAGDPYFKDGSRLTEPGLRLEMTEACIDAYFPNFRICEYEVYHEGDSYSSRTLMNLKRFHPDTEYFFIVGRDALLKMERWYQVEDLFRNAVILCAERPSSESANEIVESGRRDMTLESKIEELKTLFSDAAPDIRLIHNDVTDVSSTEIRERIRKGLSVNHLITSETLDFIQRKALYRA